MLAKNKSLAYVPSITKTILPLSPPLWGGVAVDHKSFFFAFFLAERCQGRWNSVSIIAPYKSGGSLTVKANERVKRTGRRHLVIITSNLRFKEQERS